MSHYKEEIRAMLARMDEQPDQESKDNTQLPPEDIQDVYVLIVREHEDVAEDHLRVVDSTPTAAPDTKPPYAPATVRIRTRLYVS